MQTCCCVSGDVGMLNDSVSPLCTICNRVIFSSRILNETTCGVASTVDPNEWRLYYLANLEIWAHITVPRAPQRCLNSMNALWKFKKTKQKEPLLKPVCFPFLSGSGDKRDWYIHSSLSLCALEHTVFLEPLLPRRKHLERVKKWDTGLPAPATTLVMLSLVYHGLHTMAASPEMSLQDVGILKK